MMSDDTGIALQGILLKNQVIISEPGSIHDLELRGYGELEKDLYILKPFESLYLVYTNKLTIRKGKKIVDFNALLEMYKISDDDILTKFLIYRDLRTRGYTAKDGFGFGSDFRVYDKGDFGEKGSKYLIFALNEGKQEKIGNFQKKIYEITKMGKEPIIAVIERRGEVIYYKTSKMEFDENIPKMEMKDFDF